MLAAHWLALQISYRLAPQLGHDPPKLKKLNELAGFWHFHVKNVKKNSMNWQVLVHFHVGRPLAGPPDQLQAGPPDWPRPSQTKQNKNNSMNWQVLMHFHVKHVKQLYELECFWHFHVGRPLAGPPDQLQTKRSLTEKSTACSMLVVCMCRGRQIYNRSFKKMFK